MRHELSKKPPETITYEEAANLLAFVSRRSDTMAGQKASVRNAALVLLMLDAGLRVGEAVRLTVPDLWFSDKPLEAITIGPMIAEKGCCRTVPTTNRLASALISWHESWWKYTEMNIRGWAFPAGGSQGHITTRQVERIVSNASRAAIGRRIWPHVLRHTFASRLMRTTNASIVQQLLGHAQLSSTQVYCHPNGDDLKKAIASLA